MNVTNEIKSKSIWQMNNYMKVVNDYVVTTTLIRWGKLKAQSRTGQVAHRIGKLYDDATMINAELYDGGATADSEARYVAAFRSLELWTLAMVYLTIITSRETGATDILDGGDLSEALQRGISDLTQLLDGKTNRPRYILAHDGRPLGTDEWRRRAALSVIEDFTALLNLLDGRVPKVIARSAVTGLYYQMGLGFCAKDREAASLLDEVGVAAVRFIYSGAKFFVDVA